MNIRELVPKDKFDESGVEELKKLSFQQLKPIVPDLLEWLQDMNWLVASNIADILRPFTDNITAELVAILQSDDVMWKYWILGNLIKDANDPLIFKELERMVNYPTNDEIENEIHIEATSILRGNYGK